MEYRHIQKNLQDSPRKLRLVADLIRRMSPTRALETLQFAPQAAAVSLSKALKTALANAGRDDVVIKSLEINEGQKLKRYRMGTAGRGRGRPYKKRWAHIKIVLSDEVGKVSEVSKVSKGNEETERQSGKASDGDSRQSRETRRQSEKETKEMEAKELKVEEVKEEVAEKVEDKKEENMEEKNIVEGKG